MEYTKFKFKRYSEIENTYRKKEIDKIYEEGIDLSNWRLSEKVHGSNFSFWFDGEKLKCAKRSGFLDEGSSFFNWHDVRMDEQPKIEKLWNYLKLQKLFDEELIELVLYGELFGGSYPHTDVENDPNAMRVQKEIYYSPSNHFYCFDMKVNGKLLDEKLKGDLCQMFGIMWDVPLFEGTLEECLKYPNLFQTTIPKYFNLPEIENNICEGVVIKPVVPKRFFDGNRIVLKNKNEKFSENKNNNKPKIRIEVVLSDEAKILYDKFLDYVNENRLRNVLSKFGNVTDKDFGKLMGLCQKDTIDDFLKDYKDEYMLLDVKERKYLPKMIGKEWATLIRNNFLNIIDGTF